MWYHRSMADMQVIQRWKKEALSLARSLGSALRANGVPVRSLFLFGSQAKGTQHERSDIDVAVVCEPFGKDRVDEAGRLFVISADIDDRLEPVCLHPEDLDRKYSTLVQEIRRHGIEVKG